MAALRSLKPENGEPPRTRDARRVTVARLAVRHALEPRTGGTVELLYIGEHGDGGTAAAWDVLVLDRFDREREYLADLTEREVKDLIESRGWKLAAAREELAARRATT